MRKPKRVLGEIKESPCGSRSRVAVQGDDTFIQIETTTPGGKTKVFHDKTPEVDSSLGARERKRRNTVFDQGARRSEAAAKMGSDEKEIALEIQRAKDRKAYKDRSHLFESEAESRAAVKRDPHSFAAHYNLGYVLESQDDWNSAQTEYEEALRLDPRDVDARFRLAMLLKKKGNVAEAKAHYRTILETNPDDIESHINLGIILSNDNDVDWAQTEFMAVLAINPRQSNALNSLGLILKERGDPIGAEEKYRAAIKSDPENGSAHGNLGSLLAIRYEDEAEGDVAEAVGEGDVAEAEDELREAIRINPNCDCFRNNLVTASVTTLVSIFM